MERHSRQTNDDAATGPTRPSKPVPKSALPLGAVARGGGRRQKRVAASATTYRMPMTPPVCAVGPGRFLQLQTSLGLMRARDLLEEQARSHDSHMQQQLSSSLPSKGFLKSGRLQPLTVVDTPMLHPDECLGIVTVNDQQDYPGRSRSSTMPGDALWERGRGRPGGREGGVAGQRRNKMHRSYSAVASHSFDSSDLLHPVSLVKNMALVPRTACDESSLVLSEERARTKQQPPAGHILPPVVPPSQGREREGEIWVEVRGLRKTELESNSPRGQTDLTNQEGGQSAKLPHISSVSSPTHALSSKAKGGSARETTVERDGELEEEGRKRVSVVSLGKTAVAEERRGNRSQRRRHRSGSREGRLSQGWSPPRPLEPIQGHSVSPNGVRGQERRGERESTEGQGVGKETIDTPAEPRTEEQPTPTARDGIFIDVNRHLESEQNG